MSINYPKQKHIPTISRRCPKSAPDMPSNFHNYCPKITEAWSKYVPSMCEACSQIHQTCTKAYTKTYTKTYATNIEKYDIHTYPRYKKHTAAAGTAQAQPARPEPRKSKKHNKKNKSNNLYSCIYLLVFDGLSGARIMYFSMFVVRHSCNIR